MSSQLVLHDNSFLSLVKAAILKEVRGCVPVHEKASIITSGLQANKLPLKRLLLEWEWVNEKPHEINLLSNAVSLAVKHNDHDYDLIIQVLIQALKSGYESVLSQSTVESRRFCSLVREVRDEFYRARLFTKFTENNDYLIGSFQFEHEVIGLTLNFFQKRSDKQVIILNKDAYYTLLDNEMVEFQPLLAK